MQRREGLKALKRNDKVARCVIFWQALDLDCNLDESRNIADILRVVQEQLLVEVWEVILFYQVAHDFLAIF